MSTELPTTCFTTTRLNPTIFCIREADINNDHPLISAKIFSKPPLLLLSDTGNGGYNLPPSIQLTSLREYLETFPIPENNNEPLNLGGKLGYFIICTHCHNDHIFGIPLFTTAGDNTTILASSYDKRFITEDPSKSSGCGDLEIPVPEYEVTYWADHMEIIEYKGVSLDIQILHTPGHTPDELAWYDIKERHLFVGDTLYEFRAEWVETPIIFPEDGGNWVDFMNSLKLLSSFVRYENEKGKEEGKGRVRMGCGHITSDVDAEEAVKEVQELFTGIIKGEVEVVDSTVEYGVVLDTWMEERARFSVQAPRRLAVEAREYFDKHPELLVV